MQFLLVLLAIILPTAWLLSEFQPRRWLRLVLGVFCLGFGLPIAFGAGGVLQRFNDNALYGAATADLVDTTISQLEARNSDRVLSELRHFRDKYQPSYESHVGRYEEQIREFKSRLAITTNQAQPPRPTH
jgi:hypothetical protein